MGPKTSNRLYLIKEKPVVIFSGQSKGTALPNDQISVISQHSQSKSSTFLNTIYRILHREPYLVRPLRTE